MSYANGFRISTLIVSTCLAVWMHLILLVPSGYVMIFLVACSYFAVVGPMAYGALPKSAFCPNCRHANKSSAKWCTECGINLRETQQIQAYQPPQQPLQPAEEAPRPKLPTVMIEGIGYPVLPVLMIDAKTLDALKKATKKKSKRKK